MLHYQDLSSRVDLIESHPIYHLRYRRSGNNRVCRDLFKLKVSSNSCGIELIVYGEIVGRVAHVSRQCASLSQSFSSFGVRIL